MDKEKIKPIETKVKETVVSKPKFTAKYVYLLDPGHGGIDPKTKEYVTPGKRSPKLKSGEIVYEGVVMRKIVAFINEELDKLSISYHNVVNPSNYKDVSLKERIRFCNLMSTTGRCILISIHSNAHGDGKSFTKANGYEVFTSPGSTKSDGYADVILKEYGKALPFIKLRSDLSDGDHDKEAKFTMVTSTKCPAMLIETAFHTNEAEAEFLNSEEGQRKIALAIVAGIKKLEKI